jgi:hypothetical protein
VSCIENIRVREVSVEFRDKLLHHSTLSSSRWHRDNQVFDFSLYYFFESISDDFVVRSYFECSVTIDTISEQVLLSLLA